MFAVIQVSGKQYKISLGDTVTVDRLAQKEGESLELPALLVANGGDVKLGAEAKNVLVKVTVIAHDKGKKMHVRRFIAKSRHRRHIGFRPLHSQIKITAIGDHTIKT